MPLPDEVWAQRHRWIQGILWAHVPVLFLFALVRGNSVGHALFECVAVVACGGAALLRRDRRRDSTVFTALGLLTCSAVLVHLSGGVVEMHFHYFVMVGVITLYQDWWPFLVAIAYVVLQHGIGGVLAPTAVYNHQSAQTHPWEWAGVHGLFILGMSAAGIASWRLNESFLNSITQREVELTETMSLLHATLEATADGIVVVDHDLRVTSFNERFVQLWGLPDEVVNARDGQGMIATALTKVAHPELVAARINEFRGTPEAESRDVIELLDGRTFERHSMPQRLDGIVVGRVWSFRDITDQKRLERELAHRAFHDPLTNLANQALFRDRVNHALARSARLSTSMAVLYLDLDNFKRVNDSLGHTFGDELLVVVGERLREALRATDTAARLGGDEFAILLEDIAAETEAEEVAARVVEALQRPFRHGERDMSISASVGVVCPAPETTCDQLLSEADLAMYTAKRSGKGRWKSYRHDMHLALIDRLELEADLRRGLPRHELAVHYQPIVSLASSAITGVEALVRWEHPTRGWLMPDTFIPIAEESGLVVELGRQVLLTACGQVAEWQRIHSRANAMSVSVNVSARQLCDGVITAHVREALASSGLPPACLVLELTETAMMEDPDGAIGTLQELKALGVRLAVDDFGTGYSSLSYLQRFPIDLLKIDRAFVAALALDDDRATLASTIVAMAKTLGLRSVAEGVETAGQALTLDAMGCELGQGFLFARPADAATINHLLTHGFDPDTATFPTAAFVTAGGRA